MTKIDSAQYASRGCGDGTRSEVEHPSHAEPEFDIAELKRRQTRDKLLTRGAVWTDSVVCAMTIAPEFTNGSDTALLYFATLATCFLTLVQAMAVIVSSVAFAVPYYFAATCSTLLVNRITIVVDPEQVQTLRSHGPCTIAFHFRRDVCHNRRALARRISRKSKVYRVPDVIGPECEAFVSATTFSPDEM